MSRRRTAWIIVAILGIVVSLPSPVLAAWPHDPTQNVRVAPFNSAQDLPAIAPDGAGGSFIAFQDNRSGNWDIYVQHLTATGDVAPAWPVSGVAVCTAAGDQVGPVAVSDGAGGVVIAWTDGRLGASSRDIFAARVAPSGSLAPGWPVNGRQLSTSSNDEFGPVIATDGAGGAVVAWTFVYTPNTDTDIYGARVDSAGTVRWSSSVYNPSALQQNPVIAPDGAGGAFIAFEDDLPGSFDIDDVHVNGAGFSFYGAVALVSFPGDQMSPSIAADGRGGAIVAWTDLYNGTNDLYATGVDANGLPAAGWKTGGSPISTANGIQAYSKVAPDGAGGAFIGWADTRDGSFAAYVTRVTSGGIAYHEFPYQGLGLTTGGLQRVHLFARARRVWWPPRRLVRSD